jgi:hypothetical protein
VTASLPEGAAIVDLAVRRARLDALERLDREIARLSWFAAAGDELTAGEHAAALRYLDAIGRGDAAIDRVAGWPEARTIADHPDWDRGWWDAEEKLRHQLLDRARAVLGETAMMGGLGRIAAAASQIAQGAAAIAAAQAGIADPALIRVAAGAATQAAYLAATATAAGAPPDHAFAAKLALFAAGRWPLGIVRNVFYLL